MHSNPEALHYRPQRWLKPAGLVALVVGAAVVGAGLMNRSSANQRLTTWTRAATIPTVDVVNPSTSGGLVTLTLPGDVEAYYNAAIHARVSGYLKRWYADIGARVRAGQLLAEIDTPDLDQQVAQARANLATALANQKLAGTTAKRWTSLLSQDAVSRQEADEKTGDLAAKTALVSAARAELDRLLTLESFKHIVAPFDGVVTARNTDIGALIAAGNPSDPGLFTVADVHRLRIYVHVPQDNSAAIQPGAVAQLSVPEYPGRTFQAQLVSTSDAVGAQSGALLAELQMDNPGGLLKPGDYAQVSFSLPPQAGLVRVPASALMFRKRGMAVAVVGPNDRVSMRFIHIQRDLGTSVEVATGLSPTDSVVNNPPDSLAEGELVRIAGASRAAISGREG